MKLIGLCMYLVLVLFRFVLQLAGLALTVLMTFVFVPLFAVWAFWSITEEEKQRRRDA